MIEVELNGKGGQVCKLAKAGEIQCPLIVRPTSEDVITGNVFGLLKHIRPHLWLGPLLNLGLGTDRYRQVWHRNLRIHFWKRVTKYPPELLAFREGHTEPDVVIEWENPPTSVWIEAKYLSPLAAKTANSATNDQAIRGIRTLLFATGHIAPRGLFDRPRRNAVWLGLLCHKPEPIINQYRNKDRLLKAIGRPEAVRSLPPSPFVGTITWTDITKVLTASSKLMTAPEQRVAEALHTYIQLKMSTASRPSFCGWPAL